MSKKLLDWGRRTFKKLAANLVIAWCSPGLLWKTACYLLVRSDCQDLRSWGRITPSNRDLKRVCHPAPRRKLPASSPGASHLPLRFAAGLRLYGHLLTRSSHEGAVWSISWAHPKYGNILASSSYDGKVFIWRENNNQWTRVFDFALHTASVNIISWSPHESGCLLACASSDGNVSVLEYVIAPAPPDHCSTMQEFTMLTTDS